MRPYNTIGPGGVATLTPPISDYVNNYNLIGGTAQTIKWPNGSGWCNIVAPNSLALAIAAGSNVPAVTPTTNVTTGTGSALAPAQRQREAREQSFSLISSVTQVISIEFWSSAPTSGGL